MQNYLVIFAVAAAGLVGAAGLVAANTFDERYRQQFHFSPRLNWTNDPCGLVYAWGEYHLFFQHNPFANVWGHMSWGHATSRDLLHWEQQPVAIPDDEKVAIFTGSSVVDTDNTSGLCTAPAGHGCIVSIYTGFTPKTAAAPDRQTQNLAVSQDGRTWTKYAGNPVLDLGRSDSRDPKVFWYAPAHRWILAIVLADEKKVAFFASPDLKSWQKLSEFGPQGATGGVWECPNLLPLPVAGQPGVTKWVLKVGLNPGHIAGGSGEQYFVGQFDGTSFHNDNPPAETRWVDYGRDSYCALTFNDEPHPESPRMIGWMNNWQYAGVAPTTPWRGSMTLPRTLGLTAVDQKVVLTQHPVSDIQSLRKEEFRFAGSSAADLNAQLNSWPHRSQTFELDAVIQPGSAGRIVWNLLAGPNDLTSVGFDAAKGELFVDRTRCAHANFSPAFPSVTTAPLRLNAAPLHLQIFVDTSSVEVFAQDGRIAMTNLTFPNATSTGLTLQTEGGAIGDVQLRLWHLQSTWKHSGN